MLVLDNGDMAWPYTPPPPPVVEKAAEVVEEVVEEAPPPDPYKQYMNSAMRGAARE